MRNKLIVLNTILGLVFLVTGTISYFSSVVNGTITGTTDQVILNVTGFDDEVNKTLSFGKIKPGDEGEFTLNLNMTGSGMDVIYTVDIARTNLPDNLKFYYDDVHISQFANCSKFIAYNASSMTDAVTVYWYWDPEKDSASDSLFMNTNISADISVTVEEQVYGTMKNGYNSRTEFWSDTYRPYIRTISFERGTSNVPSTCDVANLCWDMSSSGTQKYHVYAYMVDSGFKNTNASYTVDATLYDLHIACDRVIYAPSSCFCMFFGMKNLININLDDNFNTSNVTNMGIMFEDCSSLTSLDLSNFNTGKVTYMYRMFEGCSNLTNLDVSGFNTSNVTVMGSMFEGCSVLTNLDVSSFNTNEVTNMSRIFLSCSNLTNLDVSNFNTSKVTDMKNMFRGCSNLTSLDVSSFNTSNVTDMESMFDGCSSLASLNVSGFNTNEVTNMSRIFLSCSNLTNLDVSRFNTSNVINMFAMFSECSSLTGLDLSNFCTNNVTDMNSMFRGCSSLINLDLSSFNTSIVTNMDSMFSGCLNLINLDVSVFDFSSVIGTVGTSSGVRNLFYGCSKLSTTINMNGASIVQYNQMFISAATDASALITVNYTTDTSTLVDNMIATKSASSHVVKGSLIS